MNRRHESEIEMKAFKKLEQDLYDMDFSEISHREEIRKKVFMDEGKEEIEMKKRINLKRIGGVAAAAVIAATLFMQTTVAQEIVNKVIKTVSLGHIEIIQEKVNEEAEMPVPEALRGKIFTKDGKEVTVYTKDLKAIYTKDGEKIACADPKTGEIITQAEYEADREKKILVEKDKDKLNGYLCFTAKLPTYLPEGYSFDRAELYKDNEGKVENSKYIDLYFVNAKTGKDIHIQERFADEETAYTIGTEGEIEEIQIDGVKAALSDGESLDWEKDGVLYSYMTLGDISKEELIKSAESMK